MHWEKNAIQAVPSDCSRRPPVGSGGAAVEHPDVVEAEEPALEHVAPGRVLAVDPPREVHEQLLEGALSQSTSPAPRCSTSVS